MARELVITSLRTFIESTGARFGADWLGKVKMVLQCAALISVFVLLLVKEQFGSNEALTAAFWWITTGLIWAMIAVTLLSGLQYLWRAAHLFRVAE